MPIGRRAVTLGADKGYDARRLRQRAALDERDAARRPEHERPHARRSTGERRAMPAMPRASASASGSRKPSAGSRPSPGRRRPSCGDRPRRMGLHLRRRRLQSGATAEAHGGAGMKRRATCQARRSLAHRRNGHLGADHLDLVGPATIEHPRERAWRNRLRRAAGGPRHRIRPLVDRLYMERSDEWIRSRATVLPNCSTTARRTSLRITTATKPSSRPNAELLQQPARLPNIL